MDIGAPDDSDDEEAHVGTKKPSINTTRGNGQASGVEDYRAPPGPPPANGSSQQPAASRASLDGETIFAIGDDDKLSDDEDDRSDHSGEGAGLVKGRDA